MVQPGTAPGTPPAGGPARLRLLDEPPSCDGRPLTGRAAALVHALALAEGSPVGQDELVEELWPDVPPGHPHQSLQTVVSRVRALLGTDAVARRGAGYALALAPDDVDQARLLSRAGRAVAALEARDPAAAVALTRALPAVPDGGDDIGSPRGAVLARARTALADCLRARALGLDALGRYGEAAPLLRELAAELPGDEALLAALVRCEAWTGSPAAALERYESHRRLLDERGAVPGPLLRAAHEAALAAENPVRQGLRPRTGPLQGREADVRAVADAVAGRRLVTITGPGGVGKTSLAQEVASRSFFPVVRVLTMTALAPGPAEPSGARSGADRADAARRLAQGMLGAMNQRPRAGEDPRAALARAVAAPGTFLVLDDCEQLVEPLADLIGPLLQARPGLHVLVTSRRVLDLAAEHVHRLAPLTVEASKALFRERSLAARPHQELDDADLNRLLPALEGIPLAIELAAARTRIMSVGQVADRLVGSLTGPGGPRDLPERQRTLTAVIEWSLRLLSEEQRRALSRCALLGDGFTLDTAEAVLGPEAAVLVDALVAHSLLDVDTAEPPRLHMLASMREFVLDALRGDPDEAPARDAVRGWALGLAERVLAPARADGEVPGGDGPAELLLAEEASLVLQLGRAAGDDGSPPAWEDALVLGAALLACWSSSWCYSQVATWIPRLLGPAATPAPDMRGNTARMLILHRATTNAWLLGPLPESVRSRIPEAFAGEGAWLAGIRRFVRTPPDEWPALAEDEDPWTAWAAGCRVVMDLENHGELAAALALNRSLLARMRADGLPGGQLLELELDGLRLVLETGDYAAAHHECTRLLDEVGSTALRGIHVEALRLQRACCEVYLDPSPERADALLASGSRLRVPGMAAFVTAFLSGEMELLRGRPREAALTPRAFLERIGADPAIPAASPWEVYGIATCLVLDCELDERTAAELEAPAMRRRGLRALGRILQDPAASRFDLPTTSALACAVGLSCALAGPPGEVAGAQLLAVALACGPNQTSRLLSRPELERRAGRIDPRARERGRRRAGRVPREGLVDEMRRLSGELVGLL